MKSMLKGLIKKVVPIDFLNPEGEQGIKKRGHREYVGGMWDEIGQLQFDFLLRKGLKPDSFLLDIACGSLRLGVKVIPYLQASHYLGIEKEGSLVKAGLENELDPALRAEKEPNIVISDSFEFEKFEKKADFAIAQSLFTHLSPALITLCFRKLYLYLQDDGVFYATYFETDRKIKNPKKSHAHAIFSYTQEEMIDFGEMNGFTADYIGNWNHPRNQVIVEYKKV
ncbi:MAG: hypothetical protein GXO69_00945 [Acidobacteria bacterium]|nr:hypothetical protein [Acidobacteriota bacterium]